MPSNTSKDTTSNSTKTSNPWDPQQQYLQQGFDTASRALNQAQGVTGLPTDFVNQFSPEALSLFSKMTGAGNDMRTANSSAAAGGALTRAGAQATQGGLYGLAGYNPENTVDNGVAGAAKYAANPYVDSMVDAATRDAKRSVYEGALPSIERNAANTGNINSNRTGIAQGIVQRGLGDTVADTSAAIRGGAYSQGINAATSQLANTDASRLAALNARVSGGTGAVGTGVGANSGAVAQQGGLYDIATKGAAGQQAAGQAGLDNILARYGFNTQAPFAGLNNFWNVVGGANWGGTQTGTGTEHSEVQPSIYDTIGKLGGSGLDLYKTFFNPQKVASPFG